MSAKFNEDACTSNSLVSVMFTRFKDARIHWQMEPQGKTYNIIKPFL